MDVLETPPTYFFNLWHCVAASWILKLQNAYSWDGLHDAIGWKIYGRSHVISGENAVCFTSTCVCEWFVVKIAQRLSRRLYQITRSDQLHRRHSQDIHAVRPAAQQLLFSFFVFCESFSLNFACETCQELIGGEQSIYSLHTFLFYDWYMMSACRVNLGFVGDEFITMDDGHHFVCAIDVYPAKVFWQRTGQGNIDEWASLCESRNLAWVSLSSLDGQAGSWDVAANQFSILIESKIC